MKGARVLVVPALLLLYAAPALAQGRWTGRSAVITESYHFGQGLIFDRVTELTVPIGLTYGLGRLGAVALSTGYARVSLRSAVDPAKFADQQLSGFLDTEARLSLNVVPGKVVALVTGAIPTGNKTVELQELSVLGAVSSDVVGFAASNLGTGGNLGAGLTAAFPLGRWAAGLGATFRQPLGYEPVLGESNQLKPGTELRLRGGFEGPLARRTYLRAAAILVHTAKDHISFSGSDSTRNGVGNRLIGYVSVNQGIRAMSLTVYGFDVLRGAPQLEQTALGSAFLPRGNLVALGGRLDIPLQPGATISPNAEFRSSAAAPDVSTSALQGLGSSLRGGVDVRYRLTPRATLVFQGGGISGHLVLADSRPSVSGYRFGLHLELTP